MLVQTGLVLIISTEPHFTAQERALLPTIAHFSPGLLQVRKSCASALISCAAGYEEVEDHWPACLPVMPPSVSAECRSFFRVLFFAWGPNT
jgi:hypothetical protein